MKGSCFFCRILLIFTFFLIAFDSPAQIFPEKFTSQNVLKRTSSPAFKTQGNGGLCLCLIGSDAKNIAIDSLFPGLASTLRTSQDETARLLAQWARDGRVDDLALDRLMKSVDITSKSLEENLLAKIADAGADFPGGADVFRSRVLEAMDRRRFGKVDSAIREVMSSLGSDLEAVIRTGSSGGRYLELKGGQQGASGYRILFSDDDITFVGPKAAEASRMLNEILEREGMTKLKVKGFDLIGLRNVRGIDLVALDIMEPEKFLGEAGLAGIKGEMLQKGAVVAERSGGTLAMTAEPLKQFVEAKKSMMLADMLDDRAVKEAVERYGSLTVVGSCERQIVQAHNGWENLPNPEKVKYVLRQRLALSESGALKNIAGEGQSSIDATLTYLRELKGKASLTAEELSRLASLRTQNIDLAFKEIPYKMQPILDAAENSGRSLASNPEVRRAMDELTAGFALMKEHILDLNKDQVLTKLKQLAGDNQELYSMLYTSFEQSRDLVQAVDQWVASGGTREAFIDMLIKAENRLARLEAINARRAKKLGTPEGKTLAQMEEMLATDGGDRFLVKLAKNPTARKVLLASLVATGGAVCLKAMYNSWMEGKLQDNLSNAAFALIDFVPGGIGLKRGLTEGMDAQTTLLFVKDALYLTPAWPIVLVGDVLVISLDMGRTIQVQTQHEGVVDILVYSGKFDLKSGKAKFIRLELPDGQVVEKDGLTKFLFETKAVKVDHAIAGKAYLINDLSKVSYNILDNFYVPEDPVTQQLRMAAEQQLNAINKAEAWDAMSGGNPFSAIAGTTRWAFGFETVCANSPENWCKVFQLLKRKIDERREDIKDKIMVPRVIELAEAKRSLLAASTDTEPKLQELQRQIEQRRGSKLEVDLAAEVKKQADAKANESSTDTSEERSIKSGRVWQEAYDTYLRIWNSGKDITTNIAGKTGWDRARIFQFKWTGEYADDERKADQSKAGFASALARITGDIRRIKGKVPSPQDVVDKEAFAILSDVVFGWRSVLDEADKAAPDEGSAYYEEYEKALDKVRQLYTGSSELQQQLNTGAEIVKAAETLMLDRSTAFELKLNDPDLTKAYTDGKLSVKWSAAPDGTFSPGDSGLTTNFAPARPEPVTVTVTVERSGTMPAKGWLAVKMNVSVPANFLTLKLSPAAPKPGSLAGITADVPERFYGGSYDFHYRWTCSNCKVDDFDRARTAVTAPTKGDGQSDL